MRGNTPSYEMVAPKRLDDALALLQAEPGRWRAFAGGTDLMVLLEAGQLQHRNFMSLWSLDELRGIAEKPDSIVIGAMTTYSEISANPTLAREFPMLGIAARETGAIAIQNRGTLGGNVANASPAADTPPALLAYDAEIELISAHGIRKVPYATFHIGYKKTVMAADELIYRIHLKRSKETLFHFYRKVGTRKAQSISKVCFAAAARLDGGTIRGARIGLGSIAAMPVRAPKTEAALNGQKLDGALLSRARAALESEIHPIDDIRSTQEYRKRVAGNILEQFLRDAGAG